MTTTQQKQYWWEVACERYQAYPLVSHELRNALGHAGGGIYKHYHYPSLKRWCSRLLQPTMFIDIADALTANTCHGRIDSSPPAEEEEEYTQ